LKFTSLLLCFLLSFSALADDAGELTPGQLQSKVEEINAAQNSVLMSGSTVDEVDRLFAFYTDDFTYVHEVYGGTYSRAGLYGNTVKYLNSGGYNLEKDRYTILRMIPGKNAVAVERRDHKGDVHLAVFEFEGAKVARIIEYWE
jgi:hypothetical protein